MKNLSSENTTITGGFWDFYSRLNRSTTVHSVYDRFKETGRFDALACKWKEGMDNKPHIFWDSDVMKWIEGVAYLAKKAPEDKLCALVDEMIDNVAANQREDGYFNSYFLTVEPEGIFKKRENHELYCLGHAIEAAIAYHKVTGKRKLLDCVLKNIDYVWKVFVEEDSAGFVTPGHQEIELALIKLYEYLGDEKHLSLARFFIDRRGVNDKDENIPYNQSNVPVRDITEAVGHSVRACYLYTAMAMLAKHDNDEGLKSACIRAFDDIVNCKLSITGGIGAERRDEGFSYRYDLPTNEAYNETCAAIGLALFASAMQELYTDSRFGDVIEKVLYNGFITGLSLDGDKFFYSIPLEVDCKKYGRSTYQTWCERMKYFDCSCCPPNVVRTIASLERFMYTVDKDKIFCNQFAESHTTLTVNGEKATISQTTDYPASGRITIKYSGSPATLYVRIPDWCVEYSGKTENGYVTFKLCGDDTVTIDLPMEIHFMEADPRVQDNAGRYAVMRGPLVYCMEGVDNGENLRDVSLIENGKREVIYKEEYRAPVICMDAERRQKKATLYSLKGNDRIPFTATLIPYFAFANREITDMIVWTMIK